MLAWGTLQFRTLFFPDRTIVYRRRVRRFSGENAQTAE
jgi:hypothetical protein